MKLIEIYSLTATNDDCILVDLLLVVEGVQERVLYAYRASDPYSPLTPIITQWIADNNPVILPYIPPPEPTPEELRQLMLPISKRQLRLTLVRNGISLSELDTAILSMGDEAIIEWQDASEYRRLHPLLLQVAAYLELTPEQIDFMWQEALEA